jgi:hypothetical protein
MKMPAMNPVSKGYLGNEDSVKYTTSRNIVCGLCGEQDHGIYSFQGKEDGEALCALCPKCENLRPVNSLANEIMHQKGIISTSEYLSWAE